MPIKQKATTGLLFAVIILISSFDTFAATETINYSYDDMLRLIGVEHGDGITVDYVYDALGNRLAKTTTLSGSLANNPPNTPSNPSPSDTAIGVDTDANFNWTGGDPDPDNVLCYDIYFGESSPPPLVKSGNSSTTYNAAGLNSIYTYYWQIVVRDNYNEVVEGPIWSFTTGNNAPAQATDPLSIDGGSIVYENAYLSWSSPGDPNPDDTVTYDLYFGTSVSPPLVQSDYSNSSYDLGELDPSTTYYWKIVTRDNHGAITEGPVWTFTTLDHAPMILNNVTYSSDTTLTKNDGPYIKI